MSGATGLKGECWMSTYQTWLIRWQLCDRFESSLPISPTFAMLYQVISAVSFLVFRLASCSRLRALHHRDLRDDCNGDGVQCILCVSAVTLTSPFFLCSVLLAPS